METGYEEDKRFDGTFEEFEYLMSSIGVEELFIKLPAANGKSEQIRYAPPTHFKKYFDMGYSIFLTYYINCDVEVKVLGEKYPVTKFKFIKNMYTLVEGTRFDDWDELISEDRLKESFHLIYKNGDIAERNEQGEYIVTRTGIDIVEDDIMYLATRGYIEILEQEFEEQDGCPSEYI